MEKQSKSVGIWIRVSTEDQAHGESPEHHERRARYYAESKDWRVKEVYHLEAVSGKSVKDHPETQRMLRDIKSGHITGLIFSKLARLARNTRTFGFRRYFPRTKRGLNLTPRIHRHFHAGRKALLHHDRGDGPMGAGGDSRQNSCLGPDPGQARKITGRSRSLWISERRNQ